MFGCALFEDFKKMTKLLLKSYKKKKKERLKEIAQ